MHDWGRTGAIAIATNAPRCENSASPSDIHAVSKYDFRQFQADLAAIDSKAQQEGARVDEGADRLARARVEFLALRDRYQLTVADVVAFFPEEEGIQYLQGLIASSASGTQRSRKG